MSTVRDQSETFMRLRRAWKVRSLCGRYGKVKMAAVQGLRDGAGAGVCYAAVQRWLQTGLIEDLAEAKKARREYRDQMNEGRAIPQQLIDQQNEFKNVWSGLELHSLCVNDGIVPFLIAHHVQSNSHSGRAYFYLRLDVPNSAKSHAVGLKRGKVHENGTQYYSVFDPNYFEISHIERESLSKFIQELNTYAWTEFSRWQLYHVVPKAQGVDKTQDAKSNVNSDSQKEEELDALMKALDDIISNSNT